MRLLFQWTEQFIPFFDFNRQKLFSTFLSTIAASRLSYFCECVCDAYAHEYERMHMCLCGNYQNAFISHLPIVKRIPKNMPKTIWLLLQFCLIIKVAPTFKHQISLLDAYAYTYTYVSCMRMALLLGLLKQQLPTKLGVRGKG